jgi:ubiquinone/menaquinone biosynthesis C-methylase UbiE
MRDANWLQEFTKRRDRTHVPAYEDREGRNRWAASVVKTFPGNGILNLGGGGKRHLQKYLGPEQRVHEVDIVGDCDTKLNLDEIHRLPFDDDSFDTCCAFEVLEHLEHFHLICDEMYRVCKSTLFVSLPNSAVEMVSICRNQRFYNDPLENGVYSKFYGMPLKVPEDRHRWWLTFEDIIRYFVWFERANSCEVRFFIPDSERTLKRRVFRMLVGHRLYLTLFCSTVWIRIQK